MAKAEFEAALAKVSPYKNGSSDGKDWLETYTTKGKAWKPFFSHAEKTIMKEAGVAGMK